MSGDDTQPPTPPRGRPFGPGHRGRAGRRKGARNDKKIVEAIALEKHRVKLNGRMRNLTTAELVLVKLQRKAMSGDVRAAMRLDRLGERIEASRSEDAGVAVFSEPPSVEEWVRRVEIHDQFKTRPKADDSHNDLD